MKKNRLEITLGKDSNNIVFHDSLFDICHILVGGSRDFEKDKFLNSIIKDLIAFNNKETFKIALCDFTEGDYSWMPKSHLYNYPVATEKSLAMKIINEIYLETKKRLEILKKENIKNLSTYNEIKRIEVDSIILIITEYADIFKEYLSDFEEKISYILENGRICNIFVILGTKEMNRTIVTKKIESLFPTKICFDTKTAYESQVILEYTTAEALKEDEFIYLTSSKIPYAKLKLLEEVTK